MTANLFPPSSHGLPWSETGLASRPTVTGSCGGGRCWNGREERVLSDYIEDGRRASRHDDEVPEEVWNSVARPPRLDDGGWPGTFAESSGPNCFGTVMAATGVVNADMVWMLREPFEQWLSEKTRRNGDDDAFGTVLVGVAGRPCAARCGHPRRRLGASQALAGMDESKQGAYRR